MTTAVITMDPPPADVTPRVHAPESWLNERRTGIGGSDVAAILGTSPFATAYDVWLDKTNQAHPKDPNDAMLAGIYNEPAAAQRYADRHQANLIKGGFIRDMDNPFLVGTPDYIDVTNGRLVEIKCPESWTIKSWNDEVPVYYWQQIQHYLYLTGMRDAVLVTLASGKHYREWPIQRDDEYLASVIPTLHDWWMKHVLGMEAPERVLPPEADSTADAVEASEEVARAYRDLVEMRSLGDQIEEREKELRAIIEKALDTSTVLTIGGKTAVTWKGVSSKRLDQKALKAAHPEIVEKFTKESVSRRFEVKEI